MTYEIKDLKPPYRKGGVELLVNGKRYSTYESYEVALAVKMELEKREPRPIGRPRNQRLHEIMAEHKCSRPTAYKYLKRERTLSPSGRCQP